MAATDGSDSDAPADGAPPSASPAAEDRHPLAMEMEMTEVLDKWMLQYSATELKFQVIDPKHIWWKRISASRVKGQESWKIGIKGSIAGGGPSFEGEFTMKTDESDGRWMIRRDRFGTAPVDA